MNHKNTKPMDYQTKLNLPVPLAMNYQYGMQNSIIGLNVPIKETDIKLKLNIKINDIFKMDIAEICIDRDSFDKEVKKFLIKELQDSLDD
tara:strand:- start:461 stop:730 length:270 start_codon:yes stop_codon:yes gene_type:complete